MQGYGFHRLLHKFLSTSINVTPHVCIVGSGPAGFYTAQKILKNHPTVHVDFFERLPVPFGLVRYGVAPDHPEVKNCINTFTQIGNSSRVSFFGNIAIGSDVTIPQLRKAYHAVVLSYGSAKDRTLNISGENLPNVLSARRFVGWYNGTPDDSNLKVDLNVENVVVIGHGNVALDVSRILLSPVDLLKKTDIPESVLSALSSSRVKRVTLIGRRGPEHVAFTIKELREMIKLPMCRPVLQPEDFQHLPELLPYISRPRKRLLELLAKTALDNPSLDLASSWAMAEKEWLLLFKLSPKEILPTQKKDGLLGIKLIENRLVSKGDIVMAEPTGIEKVLECGLVLRSIGYTATSIDKSLPFDELNGVIPNIEGRVKHEPGLYVSGWLGTGAVGVILSTMTSGFTTANNVVQDLNSGALSNNYEKYGKSEIIKILADKGVTPVTFNNWENLDKHELAEGARLGKPREKVTCKEEMIKIAHQ